MTCKSILPAGLQFLKRKLNFPNVYCKSPKSKEFNRGQSWRTKKKWPLYTQILIKPVHTMMKWNSILGTWFSWCLSKYLYKSWNYRTRGKINYLGNTIIRLTKMNYFFEWINPVCLKYNINEALFHTTFIQEDCMNE